MDPEIRELTGRLRWGALEVSEKPADGGEENQRKDPFLFIEGRAAHFGESGGPKNEWFEVVPSLHHGPAEPRCKVLCIYTKMGNRRTSYIQMNQTTSYEQELF